jgi:hypothetical protein
VEPQVRPSGIFAQPSTVRYGFGGELTAGMVACAAADPAKITHASSELRAGRE